MISAGGMKVAYRGIFRRTRRVGRWYFLERDKDPKTLHQVKKTTLASGEPRSVGNRETRSPCLMNDT